MDFSTKKLDATDRTDAFPLNQIVTAEDFSHSWDQHHADGEPIVIPTRSHSAFEQGSRFILSNETVGIPAFGALQLEENQLKVIKPNPSVPTHLSWVPDSTCTAVAALSMSELLAAV